MSSKTGRAISPRVPAVPSDMVEALVGTGIPNSRVKSQRILGKTGFLSQVCEVTLSDNSIVLLSLSRPASAARVLRCEACFPSSQAPVLLWMNRLSSEKKTKTPPESPCAAGGTPIPAKILQDYLPTLVGSPSAIGGTSLEYCLIRPARGIPISDLDALCDSQRQAADFQCGQLLRCIAKITSPTGQFGPVMDVLRQGRDNSQPERSGVPVVGASSRWSATFQALMEAALWDCEDLRVMLSYAAVRRHMVRLRKCLDAVTQPRLVIVNAGEDFNTLVEWGPSPGRDATRDAEARGRRPQDDSDRSRNVGVGGHGSSSTDGTWNVASGHGEGPYELSVTGIGDWKSCVFGDPLFGLRFAHPTATFSRGFDTPLSFENPGNGFGGTSLVEDEANAAVRLLLYQCYHALVSIVVEFSRPQGNESVNRELAARKKLSEALAGLEDVHCAEHQWGKKERGRRGSSDVDGTVDGLPNAKRRKPNAAA